MTAAAGLPPPLCRSHCGQAETGEAWSGVTLLHDPRPTLGPEPLPTGLAFPGRSRLSLPASTLGRRPFAHCWSPQIPVFRLISLDESLQPPTLWASDRDPAPGADGSACSSHRRKGEQTLLVRGLTTQQSHPLMLLAGPPGFLKSRGRGALHEMSTDWGARSVISSQASHRLYEPVWSFVEGPSGLVGSITWNPTAQPRATATARAARGSWLVQTPSGTVASGRSCQRVQSLQVQVLFFLHRPGSHLQLGCTFS